VAAGALGLPGAAAFFQSGVERVEGGCMRHRREEIRPGILYQGFDLASHEDWSCQPDWIINLPPETRMDRWPEPSSH
jgi:hypothetical protein